ncbi:S1C family serine protease [Streptomyces sp. NPDC059272]|uniref:S1C family serine protease n=1 Tax=Streptomyces sp. NPDC059272 TaxID=3346800 RepID=UPI00367BC773
MAQAGEDDTERAAGTVAGIAARALPSVVTLRVSGDDVSGTGTGIVLDGRGDILTNNHVVRAGGGGGAISVRFSGGQTVKGEVVGRDVGYDLAVVRVHGVRGLRAMPLGNSDNVRVGDPVVAIGAPFGLDNTVTAGIVSAKERPVTTGGDASDGSDVSYLDALQTDAPINPGNSGGPLLDARGLLVGVNSAIRSADEQDGDGEGEGSAQSGSVGLGFAIPVNQAKRVAEELINHGKATHPVIGVTLDLDYAGDGARVATPKAGLKAGDVITRVDGQPVHSGDELVVRTRAHRPGDHLRLTLRRGGEDMTLSLVLGSATGD